MRSVGVGAAGRDPEVDACEELYRSDHARVVRLAYLLTGDRSFAEEVGQEAFVRLLRTRSTVREPAGYLTTITVNMCRDRGRREQVARLHPIPPAAAVGPPDLPAELGEVVRAIRGLSDAAREVVVLRYWMDLPTADIARLLDRRPATVRSLLHRAHAALEEALTDG